MRGMRVDEVRRFNRFYTRRIGALRGGLLGSELSLPEARVLYEIAQSREPTSTQLARELDLDLGYLMLVPREISEDRLESPQQVPRFAFEERRRGDRRGWPSPESLDLPAAVHPGGDR